MYVPKSFEETRPDVLHGFIRQHPFATLVSTGDCGPVASHVPMIFHADRGAHGTLAGHLARPNEQWRALADGSPDVLAIFHGPHAYISPTWYRSGSPAVPTWNYAAVHAYGRPRLIEGPALRRHLIELTAAFEPPSPDGWNVDRLPPGFLDKLQGGVVGFEIEVTRLEGKWKMGQNRAAADREGAAAALAASGDPMGADVARLMCPEQP
jgi:transcriptional regulator